jgi:hypothetical protein
MRRIIAATALALVATLLLPATAALAVTVPVFVSPPPDGTGNFPDSSAVPLRVEFTDVVCPAVEVLLYDGQSAELVASWDHDASTGAFERSIRLDHILAPGEDFHMFALRVWTFHGEGCASSFATQVGFRVFHDTPEPPPAPDVTRVRVAPDPFYPYVDDGRRDQTRMRWTIDRRADVRVRIFNRFGNEVRSSQFFTLDAGRWILPWDGRNERGRLVRLGRYTVIVTARNASGTDIGSDTVRVRRGTP